jgi:hypothetical protein
MDEPPVGRPDSVTPMAFREKIKKKNKKKVKWVLVLGGGQTTHGVVWPLPMAKTHFSIFFFSKGHWGG